MAKFSFNLGFTILEILLAISIIAILAGVLLLNLNEAGMSSRDKARRAGLEELQLAIELYKSQYGYYPAEGCGSDDPIAVNETPDDVDWDGDSVWTGNGPHSNVWANTTACEEYIVGLVPDFIHELPSDPKDELTDNMGYLYRTDSDGSAYKAMVYGSVEMDVISDFEDDFSRCPWDTGSSPCTTGTLESDVYAVYSEGAEDW